MREDGLIGRAFRLKTSVRMIAAFAAAVLACLPVSATLAASASSAGSISQSYQTRASGIVAGTLLSVASAGSQTVSPATSSGGGLVGVAASQPLLELSNAGGTSVQVVVSGVTATLVSDVNGTVKAGDKIAASPLAGIGEKATGSSEVVGTAQADLSSVDTVTRTVTGTHGSAVTVKVGLLPVAVNVAYYSSGNAASAVSAFVPPFLQDLANAVTGRDISPIRVIAAFVTLLAGLILAAVMLTTSIRSEIISVGRNPLAHNVLLHSLIDVILAALGVLLISLVAAYMVLVL